ncbi:MAG: hypothetical protein ACRDN9_05945 [Streptosporangiaceae bacterium]
MSERGEPDIEAWAASLRAEAYDLDTFVETLAIKMEACLPEHVQVRPSRRRWGRPQRTERLMVALSDQRFELKRARQGVTAEIIHVVRDVRLSSEKVGVDEWITQLTHALAVEATRSRAAWQALHRLLS